MSMNYYIREGRASDIPAMLKIENLSFPDPWTEEMFKAEFANPLTRYFLAVKESDAVNEGSERESQEEVIGHLGFLCIAGECQINNVAVHPCYRKDGVGSELLELVLNTTEDEGISFWTLETRVTNTPAINLYQKFGFEIVGQRPGYYEDGTAANLMTREKPQSRDEDEIETEDEI